MFTDEEHKHIKNYEPKSAATEGDGAKKHYIEKVGAEFAAGFLYGGRVASFKPEELVECLEKEENADNVFYEADIKMKRAFESKQPEFVIKALEEMMKFVAIMVHGQAINTEGKAAQ